MRDVIAVLLAGGVGSRLNILVRHRAKPAVPFGGIYRIIDFTLSNVANSGLSQVAVLTQYKPLSLMDHIGDGSAWDFIGRTRAIKILPPKTGEKDWDWYKGTADAVRQNLEFITNRYSRNVLVLSGDHVYYMDYAEMIRFHREKKAQVTVAMMRVPWELTYQFGIGITDENGRIVDWEEKPAKARSNLASMGIYVFDTDYLVRTLETVKGEDFGMHIIPRALAEARVYAFPFTGYWRDVGTIQAYWEANLDLLRPNSGLTPEAWQIYTNLEAEGLPYDRPPVQVFPEAEVIRSVISPACIIQGRVENSVLSPGVFVGKEAVVRDSVIMHDTRIESGALVERSIIDKEVVIGSGAVVGQGDRSLANQEYPKHLYSGLTLIGKWAIVPPGFRVGTNCIIYPRVDLSHYRGEKILADGQTLKA
ncbi:NTP transferase domain-containing protein [Thermosulfuriphilus ammonigenes]|uniref:NTP transferase domain-containing protein n=1 Tax=Thermosulfuriphilus ammonigenes TaxID=1936021 RepID=A0A6G7PX91_9BACT|nr:sugar phosphate nucleotidyltransferase [Thermosulfuriphilus ammonigenes]MBA2847727.1 glucose-1-phosphate adenylyltransferase [Thermosulfuriphilus ammonigenes]QIJ72068.1 NTP transferase domain-containing protein [Thermosulfuriphilus ammonigenes]